VHLGVAMVEGGGDIHVGDGVEEAARHAEPGQVGKGHEVKHDHPHLPRQIGLRPFLKVVVVVVSITFLLFFLLLGYRDRKRLHLCLCLFWLSRLPRRAAASPLCVPFPWHDHFSSCPVTIQHAPSASSRLVLLLWVLAPSLNRLPERKKKKKMNGRFWLGTLKLRN
jgi:hypothetical protein